MYNMMAGTDQTAREGAPGQVNLLIPSLIAIAILVLCCVLQKPRGPTVIGGLVGAAIGLALSPLAVILAPAEAHSAGDAWLLAWCALAGALVMAQVGRFYSRWGASAQAGALAVLGMLLAVASLAVVAHVGDLRFRATGTRQAPDGAQTDRLLRQLKTGRDPSDRYWAAEALEKSTDPRVLPALFAALHGESDPTARGAIALSIVMADSPNVVPSAVGLLHSGSRLERRIAAGILIECRDPRGRQAIRDALASPDPSARSAARWALSVRAGYHAGPE